MSKEKFDEGKKKLFNDCFNTIQFLLFIIIMFVGLIVFLIKKDSDFFLYVFLIGLFLVGLTIFGYFRGIKMLKKEYAVKNGEYKFPWEPYSMPINDFLKECESGFFHSYVKVNDNIHIIEVQLDDECKSVSTCYIDDIEFKMLDDFLNFKIDGIISLKEMNYIVILETIGEDPSKIFLKKEL